MIIVNVEFDDGSLRNFDYYSGETIAHMRRDLCVNPASPLLNTPVENVAVYRHGQVAGDDDYLVDLARYVARAVPEIEIFLHFQDKGTLSLRMPGTSTVDSLKLAIRDHPQSPMRGREPSRQRIIHQGQEQAGGVELVNGGTYCPVLRLGPA